MGLQKYNRMRDFKATPEPRGELKSTKGALTFVIQKHHASHLHYDFRLEFKGVLKSWAVPKGPSLDPKDKRLAVMTEDHPLDYGGFEGTIPKGHYGAGHVIVWDNGTWTPPANAAAAFKKGRLDFELHGQKLHGRWSLIRLRGKPTDRGENWLLFKRQDSAARTDYDIVDEEPESVLKKRAVAKKAPPKEKITASKGKKGKSARKKQLAPPEFVKPQLAQLVDNVPAGDEWLHEIKFDGYRTLARIDGGEVSLFTRSGLDWTKKYGPLAKEVAKLPTDNAFLDGEIIWADEHGHAQFQGLQNGIAEGRFDRMVYYVFDLLHLDGEDLRELPLSERKQRLEELVKDCKSRKIIYSQHWLNQGQAMFKQSCKIGLEGVISKDGTQPYVSGRSGIWQKTKCSLRQEFVIGGYTVSPKENRSMGALLLGVYEKDGRLRYTGRVGTGFTATSMQELLDKFEGLEIDESPFDIGDPGGRSVRFLKPKLACEIEFKAWTGDGIIRHGSFQGLRSDKSAKVIRKETAMKAGKAKKKSGKAKAETKSRKIAKTTAKKSAALKVTHLDRVIYPKSKTIKADVIKYLEAVAPKMWPFVEDRPLSILRCQNTVASGCFFQKHGLAGFEDAPVHYKDKKGEAIRLEDPSEIVKLGQSGMIELHAWGATFEHITKPDLIVFDLDPESMKLWPAVVETAHDIREKLEMLGLKSFVKATGGKGLHVQVPIEPRYSWDQIKNFSRSLMKVLEDAEPKRYTTNMIKARRKDRIFLDYLRNGYGATAVVPYSLRARETPSVAWPLSWKEVRTSLSPAEFTIKEVLKMLPRRKDPWAGYWSLKQRIKALDGSKRDADLQDNLSGL